MMNIPFAYVPDAEFTHERSTLALRSNSFGCRSKSVRGIEL